MCEKSARTHVYTFVIVFGALRLPLRFGLEALVHYSAVRSTSNQYVYSTQLYSGNIIT